MNGCTVVHKELGYKLCDAASKGDIETLKKYHK